MKIYIRSCAFLPLLIFFPLFFSLSTQAADLLSGFAETRLATGLNPTALVMAPDGRILIAEKNGTIRIFRDDSLLSLPLLSLVVDNFNERGLEGLVLDPNFEQNGYLYVYYTVPLGHFNRVSRFQVNGDLAIPGSETVLYELDPLAAGIHNGGAMQFGHDGKLYVTVGDGAYGAYAGVLNQTYGKILRLNPDGSIPEDNPFYTQTTGKYRAIYARGLRNPFTLAVDPVTGRLFTNDVGNEAWEEINEVLPGANYGWPGIEGRRTSQPLSSGYQNPFYVYSHTAGCAVIGGTFYQPNQVQFPVEYVGKYFFGDYCNGSIKVLNPANGQMVKVFATGINRLMALMTGPDGSLYYLSRGGIGDGSDEDNTGTTNGSLWRIEYTGSGAPHFSAHPQALQVPVGESARFQVLATGDAPLQFQWEIDRVHVAGADGATLAIPVVTLSDAGKEVRAIVTNALGSDTSLAAVLNVTANQRPIPRILLPSITATYAGGDTLRFTGNAFDPESGLLPDSALNWKIDFFHEAHAHPGMLPLSGRASGSFVVPRVGELSDRVWYRIYLTAIDPEGLSQTIYQDVLPRKTIFRIETHPSGIPVNVDGLNVITPWEGVGVEGMERTIAPSATISLDDKKMIFRNWDNGTRDLIRTVVLPAGKKAYLGTYAPLLTATGSGLSGSYYGINWNLPLPDTGPVFRRTDPQVDFDWGESSPDPLQIWTDEFLVVWEGSVVAYESGEVTFYTLADDGARLWVDDSLVIDDWLPHQLTERLGTIRMEGGKKYPIRMEYFEYIGKAQIQLSWSGERFSREVVPATQLFPDSGAVSATWVIGPVYPSPADDFVSVWFTSPDSQVVTWQVVSPTGQVFDRRTLTVPAGESLHFFDLRPLVSGIYEVVVQDKRGQVFLQKIRKR